MVHCTISTMNQEYNEMAMTNVIPYVDTIIYVSVFSPNGPFQFTLYHVSGFTHVYKFKPYVKSTEITGLDTYTIFNVNNHSSVFIFIIFNNYKFDNFGL